MRNLKKYSVAMAVLAAVSTTAACGSSDDSSSSAKSDTSKSSSAPSDDSGSGMDSGTADPAADLVGPGCGDYAKAVPDGSGSVAGMAQDPVAVAASNNPLLKTLVAAVSGKVNPKVNLVDTLNGGEFTVFAPVDEAFGKVPPKTMATLQKDPGLLTKVLTYHVISGQIAPADITGTHKTVEGDTVKVTGSGDNLKVDGASVICGGVHTANATVYLIDGVLQPKM
jgi:uncharacterized surface protein with fasciclin (FAS1) repeats